jgi:hypothetical protein
MAQAELFPDILPDRRMRNGRHTFCCDCCCPLRRRRDLRMRLLEPATNFEEVGVVAADGDRFQW